MARGRGNVAETARRSDRWEEPPGRFSRRYRRWLRLATRVTEPAPPPSSTVQEKLLRCLWFEQYFDATSLRTEDGRRLRLYSPGYWSDRPGPDFLNAEFAFEDGPRQRGDVELHVLASSWNAHGHANDPAYDRVRLHVVLENDLGTPTVRQRDREVPQLALRIHLSGDLQEIIGSLDLEERPGWRAGRAGPCQDALEGAGSDETSVGRFLDAAGDERMLRKAEAFGEAVGRTSPDDVLYAALMDCMGYSANRDAFGRLSQAAPLSDLREWILPIGSLEERFAVAEACLFGAAGLLESHASSQRDGESMQRLRNLSSLWEGMRQGREASQRLSPDAWVLRGSRPANHPARRIAAMAAFLARHLPGGLHSGVTEVVERLGASERPHASRVLAAIGDMFEPPDDYWRFRACFGPPAFARPMRLVGPTRAAAVLVNAAIPLLLALSQGREHASKEATLHRIFCALPPASDNAVTRYMKARMFADERRARDTVRSERRQQGLIQLFRDFCGTDAGTCETCGFLAALEGRAR